MYVKRLIEFAEEHPQHFPPLGYALKKIDWIVDIEKSGVTFNDAEKKEMIVPVVSRSSGVKATLLVDKPDYVFGWSEKEAEHEKSTERHEAYVALLEQYIEATKDEDVRQLLHVLQQPIDYPPSLKAGHFIVFRIRDEVFLHEKKEAKTFWEEYVKPAADEQSNATACMFCGEEAPIMQRHGINFVVDGERTKMISANKNAYESHGNKHSTVAPTCYVCEQKYGQALEYLLQREPRKGRGPHMFSVGDLTYVYWFRRDDEHLSEELEVDQFFNAPSSETGNDLEAMKDALDQVFGKRSREYHFNNFCLLVLSANKGRLVVRNYLEESMGTLYDRINTYLDAQQVGTNRVYGIYTLAGAIYNKPSTQLQKVDIRDWFDFVFQGRPLPGRILIALLKRIQAEGAMYAHHAAVLKSWLVSQREGREWTMSIDYENKQPAYIVGRTFAVLEKIHQEAIGSKDTLASRFFGAASTTPLAVFGMLIKNAQYHLAKIGGNNEGRQVSLDKMLRELLGQIDAFPSTLRLAEQAEFALGYYHQKEAL